MLSIGLMSGTSMDGIDSALLEIDGLPQNIYFLGNDFLPYEDSFKLLLKAAEYSIRKYDGDMKVARAYYERSLEEYLTKELKIESFFISKKIKELSAYLYGEKNKDKLILLEDVIRHSAFLHNKAVQHLLKKTKYKVETIDVIGYHGQAMLHRPRQKISIIVDDGQYLADQTGITVVTDFRKKDVNLGGQGAPFAPLYHQALAARDNLMPLLVINCGGIANITLIEGPQEKDLVAFDTGPGNGLIDRLIRQRTHGQECMDEDGLYGKKGKINQTVLKALYEESILIDVQNYFSKIPPKSLDIGDMVLIRELDTLSLEDACATLEAFTADTIVSSLSLIKKEVPKKWILAGGGWKNPVIRGELENRAYQKFGSSLQILSADEVGWNSQSLEAEIFAYLAVRSLQEKPLSFPNTTGVPYPLTGGQIYKPKSYVKEREEII